MNKLQYSFKYADKRIRRYFMGHGILFHFIASILWIWALSLLAVLLMGVLISMTDGLAYTLDPTCVIPEKLTLKNYATAFKTIEYNDTSYFGMLFNSVWYSVGCTVCRLIATTLCAYVVAKYEFKGKKVLYTFIILQMMIPTYSAGVSNYVYLFNMGLVDTPLFLLGQFAGHGWYFLVMHSYFVGIDSTYKEAAEIDGANDFVIFGQIILPIAKAAVFAIAIMTFVGLWNDYNTPIIYLDSYPTLMSGLFRYKSITAYTLDLPIYFAGVILAALPTAILFTCFSGVLMQNLTIGGIKG